jgi:hypothetical protein
MASQAASRGSKQISLFVAFGVSCATSSEMSNSEVPLRQQLAEQIVFLITTGGLKPGQQMPSVRALAQRTKVHYNLIDGAQVFAPQHSIDALRSLVPEGRPAIAVT